MTQTVYTNYWQNRIGNIRKEHGSYKSEEEAIAGIKAWWELHKENHRNVQYNRTNSGALEIEYDDNNYVYRIEKRTIEGALPKRSYRVKKAGEVESLRAKYNLNKESFLFDELAEPLRDRLILAMADIKKARSHVYDREGRLIRGLEDKIRVDNSASLKNKIPNLNI
jgi:hypothetical protein